MRNFRLTLIVAGCLLFAAPVFAADAPASGGGSAWEESYSQSIDMSAFMWRLYDVLAKEQYLGRYPELKQLAEFYRQSGIFNQSLSESSYEISGDSITMDCYSGFAGLPADSFYGQYLALPDMPLTSARYVAADDVMLYMAVTSAHKKLLLEADMIADASTQLGGENPLGELFGELSGGGDAEAMWELVKALRLDQILDGVITGELALAVYGLPGVDKLNASLKPADFDFALLAGLKDKAYLINMIERYGSDIGMTGAVVENGWYVYSLREPAGLSVMFNDEIFIAATNAQQNHAHLTRALGGGGMHVDPAQFYFDLDVARLHRQFVAPLFAAASSEFSAGVELPTASMAYLLNLPADEALGHIVASSHHDANGMGWELSLKTAVPQYLLYYLGVVGCGIAQEEMQ